MILRFHGLVDVRLNEKLVISLNFLMEYVYLEFKLYRLFTLGTLLSIRFNTGWCQCYYTFARRFPA